MDIPQGPFFSEKMRSLDFLDCQEHIIGQVENADYPSAGFAGRQIVDFGDFSIDISLEVQNQKYN